MWIINEAETRDHWLELVDSEGWYRAIAKWDGCIEYYRYYNNPLGENCERIHFCDIDDEIERFRELKYLAKNHFGEDWPRRLK